MASQFLCTSKSVDLLCGEQQDLESCRNDSTLCYGGKAFSHCWCCYAFRMDLRILKIFVWPTPGRSPCLGALGQKLVRGH
jgi:hypothetical protein